MYGLGVDLGTTWTAAAVRRGSGVEVLRLGGRRPEIPSVIFLPAGGPVLVGEPAVRHGEQEPGRLAREFKRRVGDPVPLLIGGSPYPAHALLARQLEHVLAVATTNEQGPPGSLVLTCPANWGPFKRDLLEQAARLADAPRVVLRSEPEAAAASYAAGEHMDDGDVVAVYDLGGGTFDAAVLRRTADGFELLGTPDGIEQLGGSDFDEAVFEHVTQILPADRLTGDDPDLVPALTQLRRDCVDAKEALSYDTEVMIRVALPGLHTRVRLTRHEFEAMIEPALQETVRSLGRALRSADVAPERLRAVLLAGGSSRIPLAGALVGEAFGRPVVVDPNPEHSIALGAARLTAHVPALLPVPPAAARAAAPAPAPRTSPPPTPSSPEPATMPLRLGEPPTVPLRIAEPLTQLLPLPAPQAQPPPRGTPPAQPAPQVTPPAASPPRWTAPAPTPPHGTPQAPTPPHGTPQAPTTPRGTAPAVTPPHGTPQAPTTPRGTAPAVTPPHGTPQAPTTPSVTPPTSSPPRWTAPAPTPPHGTPQAPTPPHGTPQAATTPRGTAPAPALPQVTPPRGTAPAKPLSPAPPAAAGEPPSDAPGRGRRRIRILVAAAAVLLIAASVPIAVRLLRADDHPAAAPSPTASAPACGFDEDFVGTTVDPAWERTRADASIIVSGGMAEMDAPDGADIFTSYMTAPMLLRPATGDFVLETTLEVTPSVFYQGAGLLLWNGPNSYVRIERAFGKTGTVGFEYKDGGKHTRVHGPLPNQNPIETAAARLVLRMTRTGDTITGSWRSLDTSEFSDLATVSMTTLPQAVRVGVSVLNRAQFGAKPTPFRARFARITLTC
ncbi:Hsp70 family protein [Actinoplanes sp. NPDC049118]|uniref:Hsp70 family protein n=1 Tax=Actinoplanes sp. NPDC049118 TaxID=3155769 RepID=UPI00340746C5